MNEKKILKVVESLRDTAAALLEEATSLEQALASVHSPATRNVKRRRAISQQDLTSLIKNRNKRLVK